MPRHTEYREKIIEKLIACLLYTSLEKITGGSSLKANIQLVYNNAKVATQIACELSRM